MPASVVMIGLDSSDVVRIDQFVAAGCRSGLPRLRGTKVHVRWHAQPREDRSRRAGAWQTAAATRSSAGGKVVGIVPGQVRHRDPMLEQAKMASAVPKIGLNPPRSRQVCSLGKFDPHCPSPRDPSESETCL